MVVSLENSIKRHKTDPTQDLIEKGLPINRSLKLNSIDDIIAIASFTKFPLYIQLYHSKIQPPVLIGNINSIPDLIELRKNIVNPEIEIIAGAYLNGESFNATIHQYILFSVSKIENKVSISDGNQSLNQMIKLLYNLKSGPEEIYGEYILPKGLHLIYEKSTKEIEYNHLIKTPFNLTESNISLLEYCSIVSKKNNCEIKFTTVNPNAPLTESGMIKSIKAIGFYDKSNNIATKKCNKLFYQF